MGPGQDIRRRKVRVGPFVSGAGTVVFEQLEKAFMVIGDKVIMASGSQNELDDLEMIEEKTSELIVKPRPRTINKKPLESRRTLNNMTKKKICEKAVEIFGVDLDIKTEKKELITQYLELQQEYTGE